MNVIRVMTFNIRFDNPKDGEKRWDLRKNLVVNIVRKYRPHILGIQEATWRQIMHLRETIGEYDFCLRGRVWDDTCQYPTLMYRRDKIVCKKSEDFWLSSTPTVHRSCDWGSMYPRLVSYGFFKIDEEVPLILIAVTHLDHRSAKARVRQAEALLRWYHNINGTCPFILLGDFNETPNGQVHRLFEEAGLKDTWYLLGFEDDEGASTHHNFEGQPDVGRIDWILVSKHFQVLNGNIVLDSHDGRYPSDHFPYYVDITFKMEM
ncbi:MAG: endonuclease/exonuclease/phosphatase family protein [Syntrophobacterales bacterium]|nr:endonuclease/exonuclease/phosphatase family protein [Syntrophobacterales bacterium]